MDSLHNTKGGWWAGKEERERSKKQIKMGGRSRLSPTVTRKMMGGWGSKTGEQKMKPFAPGKVAQRISGGATGERWSPKERKKKWEGKGAFRAMKKKKNRVDLVSRCPF